VLGGRRRLSRRRGDAGGWAGRSSLSCLTRSFWSTQLALEGLRHELNEMVPLVRQVMKQTRACIFGGNARSEGKLVSVFATSTEIIRPPSSATW
jgi:hypothetical protein